MVYKFLFSVMENLETELTHTDEARKEILAKRTNKGFQIILWGALILLISGLIALFAPMSDSGFDIVLYGFTSLGSAMIIYGLYLVMG